MATDSKPRPYRQRARAAAAEETARKILRSACQLWREKALDEITLQEVAAGAGVSVQTVIRHYGTKEGVVDAAIASDAAGTQSERQRTTPGDLENVIDTLIEHYERDGDAVLRTLALEHKLASAKAIVSNGRQAHRQWCERVFAEHLPAPNDPAYPAALDAFVVATDVHTWQILRREHGHDIDHTRSVIRQLLLALATRWKGR